MNMFQSLELIKNNNLVIDSRNVKRGDGFIAYQGMQKHGSVYMAAAINAGAKLVFTDTVPSSEEISLASNHNCKIIYKDDLQQLYPLLNLYHNNIKKEKLDAIKIIAVTGTNGKTSIVNLISQQLSNCVSLGTHTSSMTTPNNSDLHKLLAQYRQQKIQHVALEVSSHALVQNRINGVEIDTVAFTNLSRDHLDYHHTIEQYAKAKELLFSEYPARHAVIPITDDFSENIAKHSIAEHLSVITKKQMSISHPRLTHQLQIDAIDYSPTGVIVTYSSDICGRQSITAPLYGEHSAFNICTVIAMLALDDRGQQLKEIKPVAGRMQIVDLDSSRRVCIDYAHSPDSLKRALLALRQHAYDEIICVFGCGGNRDKGKRPIMGKIAESFANKVIITSDNPRNENEEMIAKDILENMEQNDVLIELDRKKAIEKGLAMLGKGKVLLIAGKGDEKYQEIAGTKFNFSDIETVWSLA